MKKLILISSLTVLFLFTAVSCGSSTSNSKKNPVVEQPDENFYYTCVMHPQVHETKPGNCPVCGMDLEKKWLTMSDSLQMQN